MLDGNAPTNMRLPLFFPRDAQRALDRLLTDCDADTGCRAKYPQLGSRLVALLGRLAKAPPRLRLTHPRTGVAEEVTVEASFVAHVIASALYSPMLTALVPELVDRADAGDFQGLLAMGLLGDGGGDGAMSIGMQLSVICAEDYPRIAPGDLERESGGTVFATYLLRAQTKACRFWPKGQVDAAFYEPVTSAVPALVLSGDLDPVTPPAWGQSVADHLSKSTHVIVSGTGHGAINTGCGRRMVRDFIRAGTVDGLDTGCATAVQRPPFFLTPAGPDPETPHRTATP